MSALPNLMQVGHHIPEAIKNVINTVILLQVNVVCALFEKGILLTEEKVELVGE